MPDMTLCTGTECQDKHACWRYLCPSDSQYQSMMNPPDGECEYFILTNTSWMIAPVGKEAQ